MGLLDEHWVIDLHTIHTCVLLLQAVDPMDDTKPPVWKSSGVKQRTHTVTVKDDHIYVQLSDTTRDIPSDHYNTHQEEEN